MTKAYKSLDELIEANASKAEAQKAKEVIAKSQSQRSKDEHVWRRTNDSKN